MICTWSGIAKEVKEHLQTVHKDLCEVYDAMYLHLLPSSIATSYSYKFLFAYNEIFCFRLRIESGLLFVILHYIGPAENDLKYQYTVMVWNNENTENVLVTHLVRRFTENEDDVFFSKKCLKLHCDNMERFTNEKGELFFVIKILRMDD